MTLNVNTGWYFEGPPRWLGYLFLVIAIPIVGKSIVWPVVLGLLGVIIITTRYGVEINADEKSYKEYTWFLGFKKGKRIYYDNIQYVFLKPVKVSRTYNGRIQNSTITNTEFNGFLKFSEHEKIYVGSALKRKDVLNKIIPVATKLGISILDYSFDPPEVIDMRNNNVS